MLIESIDLANPRAGKGALAVKEIKMDNFLSQARQSEGGGIRIGSSIRITNKIKSGREEAKQSEDDCESNMLLSQSGHMNSSRIFDRHGRGTANATASNMGGNGNNTTYMPALDFGRETSDLSHSSKTPPLHSDDEVTPRRGLDGMMSARKLEILHTNINNKS